MFFDELDESEEKRISVQSLYKVKNVPSATRLKEIIDPIETSNLRSAYSDIFREIQRGKALENYLFMDKYYLLALDGTQYFSSDKIHCKNCLVKTSASGHTNYSHQMLVGCIVHPLMKPVIPLAPEPIQNNDGDTKNDCERNAAKRFLEKFRQDHPKLPVIVVEDGLGSNGPHIIELKKYDMRFILGAKPGDHKYLYEWINALDSQGSCTRYSYEGERVIKRTTQCIRYVNEVPLNDTHNDIKVNFLELTETVHKKVEKITHDTNGIATVDHEWVYEKETKFSWITDLVLNQNNIFTIMEGGRKRWSIENETFNTLKNMGYNLERNYGHGHENLATNLALLMLLAFFIDQVQELCCRTFQKVLQKAKRKKRLWIKLRSYFDLYAISTDWHGLFTSILNPQNRVLDST